MSKKIKDQPLKEAFLQMACKQVGRELTRGEQDRIVHTLRTKSLDELTKLIQSIKSHKNT